MENMERIGYYYNTNDLHHQRQSYITNYLDGGTYVYGKGKVMMDESYPTEQIADHNMPIKAVSYSNTSRHQLSRAVPEWNTLYSPRLECYEPPRTFNMEQTPQSCMYSDARGFYEHYVNHARSQVQWMRDISQDPTMRSRPSFTSQQTQELEEEFNNCQYISRRRRIEIAYSLNLTEKQIKTWFQNRRVKERKTRRSSDQS